MRELVIIALALFFFVSLPLQVQGQDQHSDDKAWPALGETGKIISRDQPRFIIDSRTFEKAPNTSNPLSVTRCRPTPDGCVAWIWAMDFFTEWKGQIKESIMRPDVMMKHYPDALFGKSAVEGGHVWPHFHATGTYVFYLPKQNLFYLWGDCFVNHYDEMGGPFVGDPRLVLKKLADELKTK